MEASAPRKNIDLFMLSRYGKERLITPESNYKTLYETGGEEEFSEVQA